LSSFSCVCDFVLDFVNFQRQDGNSTDDVIDQCIFTSHSSPSTYEFDNILFSM
jgi:hypothetical protein